jgi:hypothetical protein
MKYRKKPVVIDAMRWEGGDYSRLDFFCGQNWGRADARGVAWQPADDGEQVVVFNSVDQQWLCVPKGFWVIRGLKGELYPCDDAIFVATYDPVQDRDTRTCSACMGRGKTGLNPFPDTPCPPCGGTGRVPV